MTNALLTDADRKDALSRAYVHAVAARAGYTTATYDFDRHGIDLRIQAGKPRMHALEVQLKATTGLSNPVDSVYRYPLDSKNYLTLIEDSQTPQILVVLDLPKNEEKWMTISKKSLILKRCAYWVSLKGHPERSNSATVTISIPTTNQLDVASLQELMELSRRGAI